MREGWGCGMSKGSVAGGLKRLDTWGRLTVLSVGTEQRWTDKTKDGQPRGVCLHVPVVQMRCDCGREWGADMADIDPMVQTSCSECAGKGVVGTPLRGKRPGRPLRDPKLGKVEQRTITLPKKLLEAVEARAVEQQQSVSQVVSWCVQQAVEREGR